MGRKNYLLCFIASAVIFGGCSIFPSGKSETKNQKTLEKQVKKIDDLTKSIDSNSSIANKQVSSLATGVKISLNQVTNPPIEVETAKNFVDRIISVVGSPSLAEHEKIKSTVLLLNSAVKEERDRGAKLLQERDLVIIALQSQRADLEKKLEDQNNKLSDSAKSMAANADKNQAKINEIDGFWGFSAMWYGAKRFVSISLYAVIGLVIVFVLLRVFASSSPIIGAIFNIFEAFGAFVINGIKHLLPKAASLASLVSKADYTKYKALLLKIVDSVEELKYNTKLVPEKEYTLDDILSKFSKNFDSSDKALVDELTVEAKWKK